MGRQHIQHGYAGQSDDSRSVWDEMGLHKISSQFKVYKLFISGIFYLIKIFNIFRPQSIITETTETKTSDNGGLLYLMNLKGYRFM